MYFFIRFLQTNNMKRNIIMELQSSYNVNTLSFEHMFQTLITAVNPKLVVEFGILNGFSLQCFADLCSNDCQIHAYDIFDKFDGNGAKREVVNNMFKQFSNIKIDELDFYEGFEKYKNNSIDILHIDIANNGDVYRFVIDKYLDKLSDNGVIILEGGSVERDNVEWMNKYNKPKINPFLKELMSKRKDLIVSIIDVFPSMTLIRKNRALK